MNVFCLPSSICASIMKLYNAYIFLVPAVQMQASNSFGDACMRPEKDPKKVAAAVARANALPAEKRREIARQGAAARWRGKVYKASHKGNFLTELGIDIECYVLDDPAKTPVISQRGMGQAIGFSRRGSRFTVFVNSKTMDGYIGRDLREKSKIPLFFNLSRRPRKVQFQFRRERTVTMPR